MTKSWSLGRIAPFLILAALCMPAVAQSASPGAAATSATATSAELVPLLEGMLSNHYKANISVGLGSFTHSASGLPTSFSRWIEDELRVALPATKSMKLFDGKVAAAMSPPINALYRDFFSNERVDSILYGKYAEEGRAVLLTLSLTDLSTGALVAETRYILPGERLPSGVKVEPSLQSIGTASSLASLAGGGSGSGGGEFSLSMSSDRGIGAAYRDGELLTLYITSNRDAYLKLYHVDVNGVAQLIWPNRFGGSGRIAKDTAMKFPDLGSGFSYRLGAPFGTEYIKAVASTEPFRTMEPDFADLSGPAAGAITRGLTVVGTAPAGRAEALVVYEILP